MVGCRQPYFIWLVCNNHLRVHDRGRVLLFVPVLHDCRLHAAVAAALLVDASAGTKERRKHSVMGKSVQGKEMERMLTSTSRLILFSSSEEEPVVYSHYIVSNAAAAALAKTFLKD